MSPAKTMRNTNTIHRRQRPAPQHPFVFFAPTFKGLEVTLAEGLVALGASEV